MHQMRHRLVTCSTLSLGQQAFNCESARRTKSPTRTKLGMYMVVHNNNPIRCASNDATKSVSSADVQRFSRAFFSRFVATTAHGFAGGLNETINEPKLN